MRFLALGDTAIAVELGEGISRPLSARVLRLAERLREAAIPGVVETVASFRSLLVHYDPLLTSGAIVEAALAAHLDDVEEVSGPARLWRLPACFHETYAPDLAEVAARTGLSEIDVVAAHSGVTFHVYMTGFTPGFPYMGDLPPNLAMPRRADPRVSVPRGSIAIAGRLSAVYPTASPGGWHLIGRTPAILFDAARQPPALLSPGDAVRFEPVSPAEFGRLSRAGFVPQCEVLDDPAF